MAATASLPELAPKSDPKPAPMTPIADLGGNYGRVRWFLLFGFVLASILEVLDTSIINPVLPQMAGSLGATTEEIAWVSTAYILANVIVLPMTAWLSRRFGLKRYMLGSILLFIGASALCGFSNSLGQIIIWRLVQGAAGAPLISMTQAALAEVFPRKEQTIAQGIWAIGITVAPSVAPALGGWLSDNYSWPLIFLINVPIGILTVLVIGSLFREIERPPAGRPDWLGIGLLALGLGSVQYVLEEGNQKDWFDSSLILQLSIVGLVCTSLFVVWQLSKRNLAPIVDLRVLKDRTMGSGFIVSFVAGMGLYSGLFIFPLFAQAVLGFTAFRSGMFLLFPGIILGIGMMATGIMMEKGVPARDLALVGTLVFIGSMWLLGHSTPMSNESDDQIALAIRGVGLALILLPITIAGIANLKGAAVGAGAALLGLARQLGGSIGIAIASTYLTRMIQFHRYGLMDNVNSGNPLAEDRLNLLSGSFYAQGMDTDKARMAAEKVLDLQITQQAYAMASNNVFILTGVLFAIAVPFIFLIKRVRGGGAAVAAH
jgi:DHA2 family multidrug resistance protein